MVKTATSSGANLLDISGKKAGERTYTWEELHASKDKILVVIRDVVYDVTEFAGRHPGGAYTLEMSRGQDITYLVETSHPFTKVPWKVLATLPRMGVINSKPIVQFRGGAEPFWEEVKEKAKEYFETTKLDPKDPVPAFKIFAFLMLLWSVGYYGLCNGSILAGIVLGCSRALLGIHTMHLSSHFAITKFPWVWRSVDWFCFDILMGGSNVSWNFQHILGHHQFTNVFQADPDLPCVVDGDMRRLVPSQRWKTLYKFQAIYLPVLYSLLAFKTRITDFMILLGDRTSGPLKLTISTPELMLLAATKLFFGWYQFYVPLVVFGLSWSTFLWCYVAAELAAGAWLAYFFQVNHISEKILYTTADDATCKEWAALQVEGTVDYAHDSWLTTFLSGTLNYQTTHHLFPSVGTHHYPALSKIVRAACKKHKVKHTYVDTYWQALWLHIKELHRMGAQAIPGDFP